MLERLNLVKYKYLRGSWTGGLMIGLRFLLALVLLIGIVYPNSRRISKVRSLIAGISSESESLQLKVQSIKSAKATYPNYVELLAASEERLPEDPLVIALTKDLLQKASENGVSLADLRFDTSVTSATSKEEAVDLRKRGIEVFSFILRGAGEYQGIKSFITSLEKGPREIRLTDISLTKGESGSDLKLTVTGQAFWK